MNICDIEKCILRDYIKYIDKHDIFIIDIEKYFNKSFKKMIDNSNTLAIIFDKINFFFTKKFIDFTAFEQEYNSKINNNIFSKISKNNKTLLLQYINNFEIVKKFISIEYYHLIFNICVKIKIKSNKELNWNGKSYIERILTEITQNYYLHNHINNKSNKNLLNNNDKEKYKIGSLLFSKNSAFTISTKYQPFTETVIIDENTNINQLNNQNIIFPLMTKINNLKILEPPIKKTKY